MIVFEILLYLLLWFIIGCGFCFIIAAAFFGYPEEITEERYDDIIKRSRD